MTTRLLKPILMASAFAILGPVWAQNTPVSRQDNNSVPVPDRESVFINLRGQGLKQSVIEPRFNQMLGLADGNEFQKIKQKTDDLGFTHISYQQYYNGVPVESRRILMHLKEGAATSINGNVAKIADLQIQKGISEAEALNIAQQDLQVNVLLRNYPITLAIVKNPNDASNAYTAAYKVRIDGKNKDNKVVMINVFVDAQSGKIIRKNELIAHADVPANAQTLYSGTKTITSDSYNGTYRLRDNARKIETYNVGGLPPTEDPNSTDAFDTPRDYYNTTTSWEEIPTLQSFNLSNTANAGFTSGLGVNAVLASFLGHGAATSMDDANLLTLNILYNASSLPITANGINVSLPDDSCYAGFAKISYLTGDLIDSLYFPITDTTLGVHNWTDLAGNAGTYTIALEKNLALDAHWGMEQTHDFYSQVFNRNSFDDNGSSVKNYINGIMFFAGTQNNAMALPSPYNSMVYGLGDGDVMGPVVGLDVMGHEFTHMVTEHNGNNGLIYQGESGALNESFSDMFGTAIEFYAKGDSNANWTIGEDVVLQAPGFFRSMSDPKAPANSNNPNFPPQPDTYLGDYWFPTNSQQDNGGVHINSGVPNKWFYLMSKGGSGTNDKNFSYQVNAIGIEKAEQIAYRTLTEYLTPSATFLDAYNGSLSAAADLYGENSPEYTTVKDAWAAVNIPDNPNSILPIEKNSEFVQIYPNPATDAVTIQSSWNQAFEAQVFDISGKQIMSFTLKPGEKTISLHNLSKGIYVIRFEINKESFAQKLVIR